MEVINDDVRHKQIKIKTKKLFRNFHSCPHADQVEHENALNAYKVSEPKAGRPKSPIEPTCAPPMFKVGPRMWSH